MLLLDEMDLRLEKKEQQNAYLPNMKSLQNHLEAYTFNSNTNLICSNVVYQLGI
jgi:hypothetical protein